MERDQKLTKLMGKYNEALYDERWGDAERIANLFVFVDPRNPNGPVMQQQVKERRQVAQLTHPDRVNADGGFTTPDAVALLAIERTVPDVDDVAVVLMEALKHKDPKIRLRGDNRTRQYGGTVARDRISKSHGIHSRACRRQGIYATSQFGRANPLNHRSLL